MSLLLQDKMCHCSICYSFADESVQQCAAEQNIPKKKKLCSPTDLALTELGPGLINHFAVLLTVPGGTLGLPPWFNISWYRHTVGQLFIWCRNEETHSRSFSTLNDSLFHYCSDIHRQKPLVLGQGVMTIQVQNVPNCHLPLYRVKDISEDAEIVGCMVLRHCMLLWNPDQCLLTKGKSYPMFWRNKLPLNISHWADGTWQEMGASHHVQRLCRRLDGSTTILATARETSWGLAVPQRRNACFLLWACPEGADALMEVGKPK